MVEAGPHRTPHHCHAHLARLSGSWCTHLYRLLHRMTTALQDLSNIGNARIAGLQQTLGISDKQVRSKHALPILSDVLNFLAVQHRHDSRIHVSFRVS